MMANKIGEEKLLLIRELLSQDDNSDNLISWADAFLCSLSYKKVKEIYDREMED